MGPESHRDDGTPGCDAMLLPPVPGTPCQGLLNAHFTLAATSSVSIANGVSEAMPL
jgi:hypothetical protein